MEIQELSKAARNMAEYLESRGEEVNLDIVAAQLQLMKERLRIIRQAKQGSPKLELVKG